MRGMKGDGKRRNVNRNREIGWMERDREEWKANEKIKEVRKERQTKEKRL